MKYSLKNATNKSNRIFARRIAKELSNAELKKVIGALGETAPNTETSGGFSGGGGSSGGGGASGTW